MPEQKMTYQERLDQEKGKMAYRRWRPDRKKSFDYWEEYFHHDAVDHISSQAEAIREAMMYVWDFCGTSHVFGAKHTDDYLLEHGYIEPKTEINIL